jgi:hypothetical protein
LDKHVVEYTRGWERGTFFTTGEKFKDFHFCLPILLAYLPLKFPNGQFPLKTPGPISPTALEQNKKIIPYQQKFKDFHFCLPILPAYSPLKLPKGQFPLKIPGPISQAKLKPKNKILPPKKNKMAEYRFYSKIVFG